MERIHQNGKAVELLDPIDAEKVSGIYLLAVHHHADEGLSDQVCVGVGRRLSLVHHICILQLILQEDAYRERDEQYRYNAKKNFPG
jgi:hypothetical protein